MCATCGCSDTHAAATITLQERVLAKNDQLAAGNRAWLDARGSYAINLMGSPGAGKTTLLESTIRTMAREMPLGVIEGDQETSLDADRIRATGCPVVQLNTGAGCHLDASMLADALPRLEPAPSGIVFIENVGNLICPALFDLGEHAKVVIMSVTEGADKPLKYSAMFHEATLVLLNKIDLLPYVDFELSRFERAAASVAHHADLVRVSATTGAGLAEWCDWLRCRPGRTADAVSRASGPRV